MVVGGKSGRGQREFGEALNNRIHAQTQIGGGLGRPTTAAVLSPPSLSLLCLPAREWLHANGPVRRWVPRPHHLALFLPQTDLHRAARGVCDRR